MGKRKRVSGTREWASHVVNCASGCSHNCIYCFARYDAAVRFKTNTLEDWPHPSLRPSAVSKNYGKKKGTVMFPTQHDITPDIFGGCMVVLLKLLQAGNDVLVVSKPHKECMEDLFQQCEPYKDQLLFRFTIGAFDNDILQHWEPNAPLFEERLECLKMGFAKGFRMSVSCEPMLDSANVAELFKKLAPFITDSFWIGKLNHLDQRVQVETEQERKCVERVREGQTDEKILEIYERLKDEPLVKWKESVKEVVGLDLAPEVGMDI